MITNNQTISSVYVGNDEVRLLDGWSVGITKDGRIYSFATRKWLKGCREKKRNYIIVVDANSGNRDRLHRLLAYLWYDNKVSVPMDWEVHHWDGDKTNNQWENLVILSARQHSVLHYRINEYRIKYGAAATQILLAKLHEQYEPHKTSPEIWYPHIISAFKC